MRKKGRLLAKHLRFLIAVVLLVFMSVPANRLSAQEDLGPLEYIMRVLLLPNWTITDTIFIYEENGKYYLPILELAEGFEFYIEGETDNLYAEGFASLEENSFILDGKRREITVKDSRQDIPEDAILQSEFVATDDIYVQLEVLNELWPVEMRMELSSLNILVEAKEELSFMRRLEREQKRDIAVSKKEVWQKEREFLPYRENPYQMFGKPIIDYQSFQRFDNREKELTAQHTFTGTQQLGKMLADFSANYGLERGEIERPEAIRFKLHRRYVGDDYLLVPAIKNFQGGDVTIRQRDLISNSTGGRGIVISNDTRERELEFDRITIQGTGPPGWEMELYNNDEIIEFGLVPDDGEYIFEDVVLNFGNNVIKIIFFGPQGQVKEETRSYTAGGNMLPPGKLMYKAGFVDSDRDFILLDNAARTTPRGVVKTGGINYGVNRWLSVFGNYTEIPFEDDEKYKYLTAGAAASTPLGLVEAEGYRQIGGGDAANLRLITQWLGVRLNFATSFFNHFESSDSGFDTNTKTFETEAQANKTFKIFSLPLGLRFTAKHTERESGSKITSLNAAQSISRSGFRVSNSTTTRLNDNIHEQTSGNINATIRQKPWQLRGTVNYKLHPEADLTSANSELRYRTDEGFQAALNANHSFTTSVSGIGGQIGYEFEKVLTSFEADYEQERGWEFVMRTTTSLHPYTKDGSYTLDSKSRRKYAPISSHVFLDRDNDGIFGEADEPLEDVKLLLGSTKTKLTTDENGHIVANGPDGRKINVKIDEGSLIDPYYAPAQEGFSTVPIVGGMMESSFAIIETGAIEGTLFRASNKRAVSGLTLQLVNNESGDVVMTSETAFDGYYTFEFVPPGSYHIRADPVHDVEIEESTPVVTPETLFVYGNDIYLLDDAFFGPELPEDFPVEFEDLLEENMPEKAENTEPIQDIEPAAGTPETVPATNAQIPVFEEAVTDARLSKRKDKVRLVLDISNEVDYEIGHGKDGTSLVLDLFGVSWKALTSEELMEHPNIQKISAKPLSDKGVRVTIYGMNEVNVARQSFLPASGETNHRFLIDLY